MTQCLDLTVPREDHTVAVKYPQELVTVASG